MADQTAAPKNLPAATASPAASSKRAPSGVLKWLDDVLEFLGETLLLALQTFSAVARGRVNVGDLLRQMAAVGVDSLWIVLVITIAIGAVFSFYVTTLTLQIGVPQFVGGTLGYAFLNELGPVLGGVGFAARAGASIAAEIGAMVVTEQVDALRAMAVSPIRYLVAPRVLAAVLMLPLLITLGNIAGLTGGYLFAGAAGVPHSMFVDSLRTYTHGYDLIHGLEKTLVFGLIVGIVSCQQGLRTKGGATGVGRATTSSVVLCVVLIFVSDFFLAQLLTNQAHIR